ncbi:MAG: HepT-like ribonuclease domain-containing protein [Pseudolysinimonas sp.]
MSRSDTELVGDALDHIRILHQHLDRSDLDDMTVGDAVSLRLAAAIESLSSASQGLRDRVFGDQWSNVWATRNRIAHGYAHVDLAIIRATIDKDLPGVEAALNAELKPAP